MKLMLTAADLHSLAKDHSHFAHRYLWSDGAETWDIRQLDWYVGDEAVYGGGEDSTLILSAVDLSQEGRDAFVRGFQDAAPAWYDVEIDSCLTCPWCAPWTWLVKPDWFDAHKTAYEMGLSFAGYCVDEHESFAEAFRFEA